MHVYIIAQVRQKTTTTRQREPSESGQCFVFQFSIQSLTASQQPFYSFSLLFAEGTGPPQKKSPSCRTDLSGRRGMYKRVGMGYSNPRLALIAGTRASAEAVAAL